MTIGPVRKPLHSLGKAGLSFSVLAHILIAVGVVSVFQDLRGPSITPGSVARVQLLAPPPAPAPRPAPAPSVIPRPKPPPTAPLQTPPENLIAPEPLAEMSDSEIDPGEASGIDTGVTEAVGPLPAQSPEPVTPAMTELLPQSGEIRMQAYLGRYQLDSEPLGVGSLSVVFPEPDRYEIRLAAQAKGWASVFVRAPVAFESKGKLTVDGLVPETFESLTPFRGTVISSFDLLTGQATLSPGLPSVALPERYQDRLSVIFQLAWVGQTQPGALEFGARHTMTVAGTKAFRAATFTVEGTEDLVLPGGIVVSAIRLLSDKVSGRREGQIEVWLDPSDRYLPVRMLFRETSGQSIDFLAIRAVY